MDIKNYVQYKIELMTDFREQRLDGTNLKRRDRQRLIVLVQGDEGEEGRDSAVFVYVYLHQRGSIHQHFDFHRLVTDECEPPRHCHHTA